MKCCGTKIYFLVLQLVAETLATNIGLNKTAEYCQMKSLSQKLSDGDIKTTEAMRDSCPKEASIEIKLGATYSIHFVIVYAGYGNDEGQLDFFDIFAGPKLCSKYPGKTRAGGLRVNCAPAKKFFSVLKLVSAKNKGLYISEIEIHSFGKDNPNEYPLIYRGCYTKFGEKMSGDGYDLKSCQKMCLNSNKIFAGFQGPTACYCGNNVQESDAKNLESCDTKCSDGMSQCGGDGHFSIYIVDPPLPHYLGCLEHPFESSDVSEQLSNMTVTRCIQRCDDYVYALLQKGDSCLCKNDIVTAKLDSTNVDKCNSFCVGEPIIMCGGEKHASVFLTCKRNDGDSIKCSQLFQCLSMKSMCGDCAHPCKEDFAGRHCFGREIGTDVLETTTIEPSDSALDECLESNPCRNQTNTVCKVLEKGAICECLKGFSKVNDKCIANKSPTKEGFRKTSLISLLILGYWLCF